MDVEYWHLEECFKPPAHGRQRTPLSHLPSESTQHACAEGCEGPPIRCSDRVWRRRWEGCFEVEVWSLPDSISEYIMNGKRCHTASRRLCVYHVVEALELEEMVVFRTFALNV
jgi:hypothetical protein